MGPKQRMTTEVSQPFYTTGFLAENKSSEVLKEMRLENLMRLLAVSSNPLEEEFTNEHLCCLILDFAQYPSRRNQGARSLRGWILAARWDLHVAGQRPRGRRHAEYTYAKARHKQHECAVVFLETVRQPGGHELVGQRKQVEAAEERDVQS